MTFINIEAERAVTGWICEGRGLEAIHDAFPDINPLWLPNLGAIYNAARLIEAKGGKANHASIHDRLAVNGGLPSGIDQMDIMPGNNAWSVVEYSLEKLRDLYGKRCVSELGAEMAKGMSPQEAIKLLEPLATPQQGDKLKALRFDVHNPPPPAVPLLTLKGQGIVTAGNLAAITGQAKSGKSAILGAIIAARLDGGQHLGVEADCTGSKAVIHFDTEQSPHDHWHLVNRAMRRAGVKDAPAWLCSYSVASLSTDERRKLLAAEMARASSAHGGVSLVLIDGVADLMHDPNDLPEAIDLVEELQRLAVKYDSGIVSNVHLNPGTLTNKIRGHLGSQLERKAEGIIQLEKDDEAVTAWLSLARHGFLPKNEGQRFGWDQEAGMFMPLHGTRSEAKAKAKAEQEKAELRRLAELIGRNGPRKAEQFKEDIATLEKTSYSTAERRFKSMKGYSIIHQNLHDEWEIAS